MGPMQSVRFGEGAGDPNTLSRLPFSPDLHGFTNLEALPAPSFWGFIETL